MVRNNTHLDYGETEKVGDMSFQLFNAGHTPGSSSVLITGEGKKLLFTGDFNAEDTKLLKGAKIDYKDLDAIIIESTYANADHLPRIDVEKDFIDSCTEVVKRRNCAYSAFGVVELKKLHAP